MVDAVQIRSAEERGELRGEIRGEIRGQQIGAQRGAQDVIVALLTHRFGTIPASLSSRLHSLDVDSLTGLGPALLDYSSYADVERWLTQH